MKRLIIYGSGDFAILLKHLVESDGEYSVGGFCADQQYIIGSEFCGNPLVAVEDLTHMYSKDEVALLLAIGYKSMRSRELMFKRAKNTGFEIASWISKAAHVDSSASIGENAIIFPGVQIEPFAVVGDNCIVWSSAVLCHNSKIGSHCFIAAQSLVGGRAEIGLRTFVGFNSTILQDVCVGDDCLVGAKSLVTNNIPGASKCFGTPAKVVSTHESIGVTVP